jgi:hypothetical protein
MGALGAVLGVGAAFWRAPQTKDPLESTITDKALVGAVKGMRLQIHSNLGGESITGGKVGIAEAYFPGPAPESVWRPSLLASLRSLLMQEPASEWICVYLARDSAYAAAYQWLATGEYYRGTVTLRGGPPSETEMDSLRARGKAIRPPKEGDGALLAQVFAETPGLKHERLTLSTTLRGVNAASQDKESHLRLNLDTRALSQVAKAHGLKPLELRETVLAVNAYHWLRAGVPW